MARIGGKLPNPFAQHVRMHIQIARRLGDRHPAFADHPHRLKLELAAELPSLHCGPPIGGNTLSRCPPNRQQAIPTHGGPIETLGQVSVVAATAEGGLLGIAASPSFTEDRLVYVYVSSRPTNRVVALRISETLDGLEEIGVIIDGITHANRHHGGRLRIGPDG